MQTASGRKREDYDQTIFLPSRAHHAYSMAVDHGVKFVMRNGQFWTPEGIAAIDRTLNYKFVVSPCTEHLLEPRLDDVLNEFDRVRTAIATLGRGTTYHRSCMREIFQRNGKPFAMPECGAAWV